MASIHQHSKAKMLLWSVAAAVYDVNSIANAITTPYGRFVFLMEGDRHFWPDGVKDEWASYFFPKEGSFKGAPFQVYTVTTVLAFLGKTYSAVEQARYILAHMLSKGWAPTVCFDRDEAKAQAAVESGIVDGVSDEDLLALHVMLMDFTKAVAEHHYHEIVMGAVDGGATRDMAKVKATLYKETEEEAGASKEDLAGKTNFQCWSDPYTSRKTKKTSITAIYQTSVRKEHMEDIWRRADALRRPKGFTGWRCPHAWYKKIPGIDLATAEYEKARQETRNGAWYDVVEDDIYRDNFMDKKNVDVVKTLLGI